MAADEKPMPPTAHDAPYRSPSVRPSARPGGAKALIGLTISDRYRIERLLGEGGMGAVYQAEHTLMRKRMAIKVLHPEMTRLPEVVARFEREAMAAAHIEHPNVVTATDFGKLEDGSFFLALEFVEGKSLREVIATGRLELGRALHVARQIAAALQRAHALKIVHRDLKPENVMLVDRDGDPDFVKVLDFGIAKVQIGELTAGDVAGAGPGQPVLTQAGMVYGTPEYMAPEQALGQNVDSRADLYALGIITYEMLCGVRPFEADSKVALLGMQVTAPVPKMADKCREAQVPPEVEALLAKLLAKEATERTADAKEFIEGVSGVMNGLAATGRIDARYAPAPASGLMSNPGIISGISPAPPIVGAPIQEPAAARKPEGILAGRMWLIALGGGLAGILILVIAIAVVLHGRDSALDGGVEASTMTMGDAATAPATSLDEKVNEAVAMIKAGDYNSGIKRLEELGADVQDRPDVHRALFDAYSATNRPREAMAEAGLLLKTNPTLDLSGKQGVELRVRVRNTALLESAPSKDKRASDAAFAVMENHLGTTGWDDLYDIAYGKDGVNYPNAASRAQRTLLKADRSKMTPALAVTMDLHAAGTSCGAVKPLLERAAENGDVRTLALLRPLTAPRMVKDGWKRYDALGCIHGDRSLDRAIADLDARLRKR